MNNLYTIVIKLNDLDMNINRCQNSDRRKAGIIVKGAENIPAAIADITSKGHTVHKIYNGGGRNITKQFSIGG